MAKLVMYSCVCYGYDHKRVRSRDTDLDPTALGKCLKCHSAQADTYGMGCHTYYEEDGTEWKPTRDGWLRLTTEPTVTELLF